jgi:glucose/arabinose dehydrogenase
MTRHRIERPIDATRIDATEDSLGHMSTRCPYRRGRSGAGAALVLVVVLGLAAGCGAGDPDGEPATAPTPTPAPTPTRSPDPPPAELTEDYQVVATGLRVPWDVDFLPDGAALVTERTSGRILQIGPESAGDGLRVSVAQTIDGVNGAGEGGLLGIAVSPDYSTDESIYIYYSTEDDNRIARLVLGEDPEPILTGIPRAGNHNGGQVGFGPDGYLYASTGDAGVPSRSQDRDSLAGKILRMTTDGEPAPDNPFDSLVWAYGLRNVQGLAWDGKDLWATEFGAAAWDEINLIRKGENYGWPEVEGPGGADRYVDPVAAWRPNEAACSGAAVVGRTLVASCLRGQRLWLLELGGDGTVRGSPEARLVEEYGRLRAASVAPDGSLWLSTSNWDGRLPDGPRDDDDRLIRVATTGDGAGRP